MTVRTAQDTGTRTGTPGRTLLRRRAAVYLPQPARTTRNAEAAPGVELLEADLLDRGWLLSPSLRAALIRLDAADLVGEGSRLLADCDALLGSDRPHVPLFRNFPASTPRDSAAFYVSRVLVHLFQDPHQPCVLCEGRETVRPVSPCGHLVCTSCFDGTDLSACPICHRRIDPDDPFLRPGAERPSRDADDLPERLRVLHLGTDLHADAEAELTALLARTAALSPTDADDLTLLLDLRSRDDLDWLPARLPGRETKARVLSWLMADPLPAHAVERAGALVDTATDVLRLLVVRSGGSASPAERPRIAPVPRPLRRALLALLDGLRLPLLVEDMRRNRGAWIAVGERLHPGEHARRHPTAALAFAVLRGSDLGAHPAGADLLRHAAGLPGVEVSGGRVNIAPWGRAVEHALGEGDVARAADALATRPGELVRRLDQLLRGAHSDHQQDACFSALATALPRVSPAVLLSALGQVRTRDVPHRTRVFFPAGRTATAHVVPDDREPLPGALTARAVAMLEGEVLRRAALLPPVRGAVLDTGLDGLRVPFTERTAARSLVSLARGSVLPVPSGRYLRLFCHWTEHRRGPQVDLDLSVALFDEHWQHVGTCDYTSLSIPGATHSGDLTSAPPPLGSSEFVDLDLDAVSETGARYAVVAVFSFTNVPFSELDEAFAGVMVRSSLPGNGEVFDARAVEQRFDLAGPGRTTLPLVVDLADRELHWQNVTARVTGDLHSVAHHQGMLGVLGSALVENSRAGMRVTLGELGRWHAAARAQEVFLRDGDRVSRFTRRPDESVTEFAGRLRDGADDGAGTPDEAAASGLHLLVRGDLAAPAGAQVYALHPAGLDAANVHLLGAADLAAQLDPAAAAS